MVNVSNRGISETNLGRILALEAGTLATAETAATLQRPEQGGSFPDTDVTGVSCPLRGRPRIASEDPPNRGHYSGGKSPAS